MMFPEFSTTRLSVPVRLVVSVYGCCALPGTAALAVLSSFTVQSGARLSADVGTGTGTIACA